MTSVASKLTENLSRVRDRIAIACDRAGRQPGDVTLVAVTKYADLDWVRALVDLGVTDLGESRPQQLVSRAAQLPSHVRWHLIGHLQRNKVDSILPVATWIHSVDSERLLEALGKALQKRQQTDGANHAISRPRMLLEVNVSGEGSKDGFDPVDLLALWPTICERTPVSIHGLMTMAPLADSVEAARPFFRALREFRDRLIEASGGRHPLPQLSMGMSGDFEVGIEEGATLVRVGSSLFTGLQQTEG